MTLQAVKGADLWLGFPFSALAGATALTVPTTTMTFDAANDQQVLVFDAPKTGDIYDIEFNLAASTLSGTLRVGFVVLSGAQFPGSPATFAQYADFVNPTSGWKTASGYFGAAGAGSGAKLSVTAGDIICLTFECTSYTSGNCTLSLWDTSSATANVGYYPYGGQKTGAGAIAATRDTPCIALYYDNAGSKESVPTPVESTVAPWNGTVQTLGVKSTNPKMAGLRFIPAVPMAIDSMRCVVDNDVDMTLRVVAANTTTNLVTRATVDKDQRGLNGAIPMTFRFAPITLTAGTTYRIMLENSASATACNCYSYDVASNAVLDACGGGKDFFLTQSNTAFASLTGADGTDYTDTNTSCPLFAVHVSKLDDGAGGTAGMQYRNLMRGNLG